MTPGAGPSLGGIWAPLLLADPSPNLRLQVLRELMKRPAGDSEVQELVALRESDPLVQDLLSIQDADGSWPPPEGGGGQRIRSTAQALVRLGYLGFDPGHPAVQRGTEYLFDLQEGDGSWPLPQGKGEAERELREGYTMIPLQTGMPLRALAMVGYATDPRAEQAYEWLLARYLHDGGWPTGMKGGKLVFAGGYRRLAHSQFGCRTNTTFAVCALAHHPERRKSPEARRGLDLLLAQDSLPGHTLGFEVARTIGVERARGFFTYFARYDVGLILELCWRVGASLEDPRVAGMVEFVRDLQGPYGLWVYAAHPEATRWVSFDVLRSLSRIDVEGDWSSLEPRTPFQPYPKRPRRY